MIAERPYGLSYILWRTRPMAARQRWLQDEHLFDSNDGKAIMRHTIRTLVSATALGLALAGCATGMDNSTSGSSTVAATGSGSGSADYDGMRNNNGNGEAGTTPMPGSLGATSGEQIQ